MKQWNKLKNLAIVAHVDHGKTTMVDQLLKQSHTLGDREEITERVMDSGELEKERGITISAKNCSLFWGDCKVNLMDTPGHADFAGEVERSLMIVDGILLLVDAAEGPLPQTRFVLQTALQRGLKMALVINKVDRPDSRVEEVQGEAEDLLLELADYLGLEDLDLDLPVFYASAKEGWAVDAPDKESDNLTALLDFLAGDYFTPPECGKGEGPQMLVTDLNYSPYLGQMAVGRLHQGTIRKGAQLKCMGEKGEGRNFKVSSLQIFEGLGPREVEEASAGEIVMVAGTEGMMIGDTLCGIENPEALPRIKVHPPTVSIHVSVSTSPLSGREGEYLTSRKLEELLEDACKHNVALEYAHTEDSRVFELKGRGELQLAIVFEEIRRKGFEFMVGRPQVITEIDENGQKLEPYEKVVLDIPDDATGRITEEMSRRKGQMTSLAPLGEGRQRIEFEIPSRGLIGYRSQFLTETKGEGLMSGQYLEMRPYAGDMLSRQAGAIISDRGGKTTPYALFNLLSSGKQFIRPGEQVYEGMVIGEHSRTNDINVNCVREKHVSSMRTAGKDVNIILPPVAPRNLDWALDWIDNDEWVEVTPENIRIRKKELLQNMRSVVRK